MQTSYDELGEAIWEDLLDENLNFDISEVIEASLELSQLVWQISKNLVITTNIDKVLQWACPNPKTFRNMDVQKKNWKTA